MTEESEPEAPAPAPSSVHLSEVSSTRINSGREDSSTTAKAKAPANNSGFNFGGSRPAVRQPPSRPKEPETAEEWKDRGNEEYKVTNPSRV